MRFRKPLILIVVTVLFLCLTSCGEAPLLSNVTFSLDRITPNADHVTDVTVITYDLSRSAEVSIYFEDDSGERYIFRDRVYHAPSFDQSYQLQFGGVVEGYLLPDERSAEQGGGGGSQALTAVEGVQLGEFFVEERVLQDGEYTWTVEAVDEDGVVERATGTLTVAEADTQLPRLEGFSVNPPTFTPNRDGISDRAQINVYLTKEVDSLSVYLLGEDDTRYYVEEVERVTEQNQPGLHSFDYDAGVDHGAEPPPDGTYPVRVEAQDAVGQRTSDEGTLTIRNGGVPRPDILNATVEWSSQSVALGQTLHFTLTVDNDSTVPIRTSGPSSGTVYDNDQNYATLEEYIQSGVFRVGVHCENSPTDHPWRWAVGGPDDLYEEDGHFYLPAGGRAMVTGGIRFVEQMGARNPQYCYASLIHEDVEIAMVNYRVDPVYLRLQIP